MTMHVVLGDGEMSRKELTETLTDIWKADEEAGSTFWFLLQGKPEPSDTDKALVTWLEKNEIYYEVITDDKDSVDAIYSQPQEVHEAKKLALKVVNLLKGKPEEDEKAELLALFTSDDPNAEADRWLNDVCQAVFDADFPIRALNDGLVDVDMSEESAEAEAEPEPEPAKPAKAVAKKAAARPSGPPDTPVSGEGDDTPEEASKPAKGAITRAGLEELDLDALKDIAKAKGIVLPPRTRMSTYIDKILGEDDKTPEAEVSAPAEVVGVSGTLNGTSASETDLAERIADIIIVKFLTAVKEAINEVGV